MIWVLIVWTLTVAGGVETERTQWASERDCTAYRESIVWRQWGRADGTGTLVGPAASNLPGLAKPKDTGGCNGNGR